MFVQLQKNTPEIQRGPLDEIRGFTGGKDIKRIITDDGGEFKGPVNQLLDERGIAIQRALGIF